MKSSGFHWIWMSVIAVALVSGLLSVPVWKQNRYLDLMREKVELQKEILVLRSEITKHDMESRRLSSLSRIEPIAKTIGLGFYAVPIKVQEIP